MNEEPLAGGNTTPYVVRIGETVHRSRGHHSDRVARILLALEAHAYPYSPRYLGQDADGHDVLTYIDGVTTSHPSERKESSYGLAGRMLRSLHDLTAGSPEADGGECVAHGDPGPFNTIFRDGVPVCFIDWDSAGPGKRRDDLGYAAWTWCIQSASNVPIADQAQRVVELVRGYGRDISIDVLHEIEAQQTGIAEGAEVLRRRPAESDDFYEHQARVIEWASSSRALLRENRAVFEEALQQ